MRSIRTDRVLLFLPLLMHEAIAASTNTTSPKGLSKFGTWPYSDALFEGPQVSQAEAPSRFRPTRSSR